MAMPWHWASQSLSLSRSRLCLRDRIRGRKGSRLWEVSKAVRSGAGGMEAERDTWVRRPRVFSQTATSGKQEWELKVAGDARPVMRRMTIENLKGRVEAPFLLSDKNYDFRSLPELVASVVRGAKTDEQKALALRELLIGEGFLFHHATPVAVDPIQRLTNAGYGYCGVHAQIYDQLAYTAGLRVRTCSHSFSYGHSTNEVFYDGQWHFMDTNGEAIFRRADGVIPSYEEMRRNPGLVPSGDAYGQTSYGIDGARYTRALYTGETTCVERKLTTDSVPGTLDFPLREGESITWEWQDADFSKNRANGRPSYGTGRMEYRPRSEDMSRETFQIPVHSAYPILEMRASARLAASADRIVVRLSKDGGKSWSVLAPTTSDGLTVWKSVIDDPDACVFKRDKAQITNTTRSVVAAQYGYVLEFSSTGSKVGSTSVPDLQIVSVFRHYPPALPYLDVGDNRLTYVDRGARERNLRITLEFDERSRPAELSSIPSDWGWSAPQALTSATSQSALPVLAEGPGGALHLVYSIGAPRSRRIAYRKYLNGKWSDERLVTPAGIDANHPVVAEDRAGTVWIAYQTDGLWSGGDVYVISMNGQALGRAERLNSSDPYHIAFFPSISASGQNVAVSWEGGEPGQDLKKAWGTEVGWMRVYDGKSWSPERLIKGEPFKNLGLPKLAYDSVGRLHLTGTKGPRYYRSFPPMEVTGQYQWMTPEWMYHSRGGALYSDRAGNVWSIFDGQNSGTTSEIYLRMLPSSARDTKIKEWTQALRISEDDKRPSIYPNIVAEDASRVAAVWMDYRHKSPEVYAKILWQWWLESRSADLKRSWSNRSQGEREYDAQPDTLGIAGRRAIDLPSHCTRRRW